MTLAYDGPHITTVSSIRRLYTFVRLYFIRKHSEIYMTGEASSSGRKFFTLGVYTLEYSTGFMSQKSGWMESFVRVMKKKCC